MREQNLAFTDTQNDPPRLQLAQARRNVLRRASRILYFQIAVIVVLPSALSLLSFLHPTIKPATALIALIAATLDIFVLDRWQKQCLRMSAKLQERFDCDVFGLDWNPFVAGSPVQERGIRVEAEAYSKRRGDTREKGWYPESLSTLPIHLACLAAQRVNLSYDYAVRSSYRMILTSAAIASLVLLVVAILYEQTSLAAIVLGVLVPVVPIVSWCSREFFRQSDARAKLKDVIALAELVWHNALAGRVGPGEAHAAARRVQDASYVRRSSAPVVFEKLYWLRRSSLESSMQVSAGALIKEYLACNNRGEDVLPSE